jgi:HEAT repeat protein
LKTADGALAADICWVLGRVGPDASAAVPALMETMKKSTYTNVRDEAARALRRIGPAAREAIPALAGLLEKSFGNRQAIKALVHLGQGSPDLVVAALTQRLMRPHQGSNEQEDRSPHIVMAHILTQLGPKAKAAAPQLTRLLHDRTAHPYLRVAVAEALWRVQGQAQPSVAELIVVLRDSNWSHGTGDQTPHGRAAEVLDRIGPEAKAALPDLEKLLKSDNRYERFAAATALWGVARESKTTVPVLVELLKAGDLRPPGNGAYKSHDRPLILGVLARIGPEAREAVPAILQAIHEEDEANARNTVKSWIIHKDDEDKVEDEYTEVRRAGLAALLKIAPEAVKQVGEVKKRPRRSPSRKRTTG